MKKILILIISILFLVSCSNVSGDNLVNYNEMVHILNDAADFKTSSEHFNISVNYATIDGEDRFYIIIDNPTIAMYDVKVIAYEENYPTDSSFAPNVGIFDDSVNLIPNQINMDNGFVKGISISGVHNNHDFPILCFVQWSNETNTKVYREFFKFNSSSLYRSNINNLNTIFNYE